MTNTHIALFIVLGLLLLIWWWIRLMEEYQPNDVPSQYGDIDYRWYTKQHKTYLVYGHTNNNEVKIVVIDALNAIEALEKAKAENPLCTFSHAILGQ